MKSCCTCSFFVCWLFCVVSCSSPTGQVTFTLIEVMKQPQRNFFFNETISILSFVVWVCLLGGFLSIIVWKIVQSVFFSPLIVFCKQKKAL